MNLGSVKSIKVFTFVIIVIIITVGNSNADGKYDIPIYVCLIKVRLNHI